MLGSSEPDKGAVAVRSSRGRELGVTAESSSRLGARFLVGVAIIAVLSAAAVARLWPLLHGQPGGLYHDEAAEGLSAIRILSDSSYRPVFIDENGGREALFAYLVAVAFHFTAPSVTALRATSALVGVAGIVAAWPLLRRFGTWVAVVGIAWMAGSPWLIATSDLGLRNGLTVPFASLAAVALLAWADRPQRRFAFIAGFAVGAGLWTYQPLKLTPLLVLAWLWWLRRRDRQLYDRLWAGRRWVLFGYALAAAPYIWTAATDTLLYFGRAAEVSPFNPPMLRGDVLSHTLQTMGMFFVAGDPNPRHDVSALPVFLWPLPVFAAVGLWRLIRDRAKPASSLALGGLVIFMLPPLLALQGGVPHLQRALGLAPLVALLVGLGVAEVVRSARRIARPLAMATGAASAGAILLTAAYGGWAFATRPVTDRYDAFELRATALAAAGAQPRTAVIVNPAEAQIVRFLDGSTIPILTRGQSPPAGFGVAALWIDDFPAALRSSAVVYERDPGGHPTVWVVAPP